MNAYLLSMPEGEAIPYQLERRQRKTIGLRITPEGLVVWAPKRISQAELEKLLRSKARWIRGKLDTLLPATPMSWQDGATLSYLGNPITLRVRRDTRSRAAEYEAGILYLALPVPEDEAAIAHKVVQWYRKEAMTDFSRRLELLSARLGLPFSRLLLSNAQSRWGSCNSKGEIRLNWRLIQAPPAIIHYVVAHELAHLREMNHSARFWAVVESLCPDYRNAEKALKDWSVKLRLF
jgi:predicted metal-dependent hydrolase